MAFNILQKNINGIVSHEQKFKFYLSDITPDPDIVCLQETCLKSHLDLTCPEYSIVRKDRHTGAKGGSAMFIRDGLSYASTKLPNYTSFEARAGI